MSRRIVLTKAKEGNVLVARLGQDYIMEGIAFIGHALQGQPMVICVGPDGEANAWVCDEGWEKQGADESYFEPGTFKQDAQRISLKADVTFL